MNRNITVELLNPQGVKLCDLYDSGCQFEGQISNIKVQKNKKELTELTFTLPTKITDVDGELIDNPRWQYIRNEYRIRYTDGDDVDIFLIKTPEETNNGVKITESVSCLNLADLLKSKNITKSREHVIGNAEYHLHNILEGTGWAPGKIDEFYEEGLYEKYFEANNLASPSPHDASFGAYAEIRMIRGATDYSPIRGFIDADITVTSVGKNLFDGMLERGDISDVDGLPIYEDSSSAYRSMNYIYVAPFDGRDVTISGDGVGGVVWYLYNGTKELQAVVSKEGSRSLNIRANTPEGIQCQYIKFVVLANEDGTDVFTVAPTRIQLEIGEVTEYEKYQPPYIISATLGKYDTLFKNRIVRGTGYRETSTENSVFEKDEKTIETLAISSAKLYKGGWIYLERTAYNNEYDLVELAYTVLPEVGGVVREKYRNMGKESGTSAYDELMDLAEIFECNVRFHGDTKTVDLLRLIGKDTHFAFKPKYSAKSIKRTKTSNEFITRLFVVDQESENGYIGIEDVNPLGTNFIMDFSHFDISEDKQAAIDLFKSQIQETKDDYKNATDTYIENSNLINNMIGQTPMGMANITHISGLTVGIDKSTICSFKERTDPQIGDFAYIRVSTGMWEKYKITDYQKGQHNIVLDKAPEEGSVIWWMKGIPAGTVGAQIITLNAQHERRDNYQEQSKYYYDEDGKVFDDLTDDEKEDMKDLQDTIEEINNEINELTLGAAGVPGINESFARLVAQIMKYNDALDEYEGFGEQRGLYLKALEDALGDIIYDAVFPQGDYASGQELDLYNDAVEYLKKRCRPQAEYSVTAIDPSEYDGEYRLENIGFGDIVYIYDEDLGLENIPAEVSSYTDEPLKKSANSFTLGNFGEHPIEFFKKIVDAGKTISESKYKYDKAASCFDEFGKIKLDVVRNSLSELEIATKNDMEQLIKSYFTTETMENAGINWSKITLVSNEITLRARNEARGYSSSLKLAIDSIEGRVQNAEGEVSTLTQTVDTIRGQVQGVDGKVSTLTQTVDSIEGRVEDAEGSISTLNQRADQIVLSVNQISIGGSNLFEKSADTKSFTTGQYSSPSLTITHGEDETVPSGSYISFTMETASGETYAGGPYIRLNNAASKMRDGETYTISAWVWCSTAKTTGAMGAEFMSSVTSSSKPALEAKKWTRHVITGTYSADKSMVVNFYYGSQWKNGDEFRVSSIKIEHGNKVTDWTQAPEELIVGTSVEITKDRFRVTSPSSEFAIPGSENGESIVSIDEGGLYADKITGPVVQTFEGGEFYVGANGDFATLSDAFSVLNDKHLEDDVILKLLDANDSGGTLQNISGGKVIITPVNLINSAITAPITNESATLYSMSENGFYLKPASAGSLRRSIFEIGHVGAMGVRGKRITFRCRMYSASAATPAYPHVRIYCGESYSVSRHITSLTRTDTSDPTSWLEYAVTFTVPVDAREDDILWMRFHASSDNQPVDAAATAYFRSTLMEIGDAVNSGGVRTAITNIASLAIRNCSSRICLHGVSIGDTGLTVENSSVSANRSTFNGTYGFSLWGGSGAIYNCYGTCTKLAADARGGGSIEIFGLAPTGTKSGMLDTSRMATSAPPAVDVPDITTQTAEFTAKATGTYSGGKWWTSDAAMRQGYTTANGVLRGAAIFDLSSLSGKTVDKAVLKIKRVEGYGKGGSVKVKIYRTNITSLSNAPSKYDENVVEGNMAPGEVKSFDVTNILRRDNLTKTFVLWADDGAVMDNKAYSTNYARFAGTGNAKYAPVLTVTYK